MLDMTAKNSFDYISSLKNASFLKEKFFKKKKKGSE